MRWVCLWSQMVSKNNKGLPGLWRLPAWPKRLASESPSRSGSACLELCPRLTAALGPGRLANTVKLWCQCQSKVQPPCANGQPLQGPLRSRGAPSSGALRPPVTHAEGMFKVPQKMGKGTKREGIPRQAGLEDLATGRALWSCARDGKGSAVDQDQHLRGTQ